MVLMKASVSLSHPESGYFDEVFVEDILDRNCFSYTDNQGCLCEMCIYDDGLCFFRQDEDHLLELHLKSNLYAKVTSTEGIVKFDVKTVDFKTDGDILVMHYLIDDEERIIEVKYC